MRAASKSDNSNTKMAVPSASAADPAAVEAACRKHGLAEAEFRELHRRCVAAKATAYCPYSRFRVGASVLSREDGEALYIDGANVENASYPVGTCAERVAIGKAVTAGYHRIAAVAVATDISPPASPCKCLPRHPRVSGRKPAPSLIHFPSQGVVLCCVCE